MNERQCRQCGEWYEPIFFESGGTRRIGMHTYAQAQRSICKGCSQTIRDQRKLANRWRAKMRSTRKMHAQKFGKTEAELESVYKWNVEQMEHDARHAYENGCPSCGETFARMGHGLADITLDIIVRDSPPTYGYNTRWLCATCNRQKGKYTMKEYSTLMREWQRWKIRTNNPWHNTLFSGMNIDVGTKSAMEYRRRGRHD